MPTKRRRGSSGSVTPSKFHLKVFFFPHFQNLVTHPRIRLALPRRQNLRELSKPSCLSGKLRGVGQRGREQLVDHAGPLAVIHSVFQAQEPLLSMGQTSEQRDRQQSTPTLHHAHQNTQAGQRSMQEGAGNTPHSARGRRQGEFSRIRDVRSQRNASGGHHPGPAKACRSAIAWPRTPGTTHQAANNATDQVSGVRLAGGLFQIRDDQPQRPLRLLRNRVGVDMR